MKATQINIRDPYVLKTGDTYYLYGTRSATCWGPAEGFDCYKSIDLENWEGPIEIFKRPKDFWADQKFWAPECYEVDDRFYLVTTFGAENIPSGIQILQADKPEGPFTPWSDGVVTPKDWYCIDGTLYWEEDQPYLIFSHAFEDDPNGFICYIELSKDLKKAISEPQVMTSAVDAPWAKPVPFAKQEFGMDGDVYFTDGPCMYRMEDGKLLMIWSSWSTCGYAVGIAESDNGSIRGNWSHQEATLFPTDGGHGMWFDTGDKKKYTLHYPNAKYEERPVFYDLVEQNGTLILEKDEK